jgi:hypothetical protein
MDGEQTPIEETPIPEPKIYAAYAENGEIAGFYRDDVHSVIPDNTVEITAEQWEDCLTSHYKYIIVDGELVEAPVVPVDLYKPVYDLVGGRWIEGLTTEEISAINAPKPFDILQANVVQLQDESVMTMLALTDAYETEQSNTAQRETENIDTMLALTEAYELILAQNDVIAALEARIAALEGSGA